MSFSDFQGNSDVVHRLRDMLARNHFNRFNLVFAHQTAYLAPPYPFWLDLPDFPEINLNASI